MPNNIHILQDLLEEISHKDCYVLWLPVENWWQSDYTSEERASQCFLKPAIMQVETHNFIQNLYKITMYVINTC
jgi:hypothetical protein